MSVVLSEHLPLLATAPDGIQKLRGLILELAVRGKLVPQDPNDEHASELLKRIAKERARLEAEGKIKKSKPLPAVGEDEQPFALPEGWVWGRIADIANSQAGFAFKSSAFNDARIGMPLTRIRDVGFSDPTTYFDGPFREEFVVTKGDYLVSMDGQFRVAEWKGPNALLNQRVSRLQFYSRNLAQAFFAISLHIRLADLQGIKAYTTVDHLSGGQISAAVVGVPPLSEQHRIVAKVDELMALCDRLEAEQSDAAVAHERLVATLLGTLTQSTCAADLGANWQRLAEHFDTLFATESSLDALKQTILQLAVMGKLVPQDPNDEHASELLKRIAKERAQLEAAGICKKSKPMPVVRENEQPFALPDTWIWARLATVSVTTTGKTPATSKAEYYGNTLPFIGPGQLTFAGELLLPEKMLSDAGRDETTLAEAGDILMVCIGGSIGKAAIANIQIAFNQQINCASPILVSSKYLYSGMTAQYFQKCVFAKATGSATPIINRSNWDEIPIPVPPLAEQHRIVAKVDELLALVGRLKAGLAESRTRQAQLADTLIESALAAA